MQKDLVDGESRWPSQDGMIHFAKSSTGIKSIDDTVLNADLVTRKTNDEVSEMRGR